VGIRKTISDSWLLQDVDLAEGMTNVPFIDSIKLRTLQVLHIIGMQNTFVLRRNNMAVIMF